MPNANFKTAFSPKEGQVYQLGVEREGEKLTPSWIKKSYLSLLVVPFFGTAYGIIHSLLTGAGREHIPMWCGAGLSLVVFGLFPFLKKKFK